MPFLAIAWSFLQRGVSGLLTFCSKPPGSWIAAALGLVLGLWWFGHLRYAAGFAAAAALAAARSAQIKAKQNAAISGANDRAAVRAVESNKQNAETQEAVVHVKESAAAMPDAGGVAITSDVADRLRDIK